MDGKFTSPEFEGDLHRRIEPGLFTRKDRFGILLCVKWDYGGLTGYCFCDPWIIWRPTRGPIASLALDASFLTSLPLRSSIVLSCTRSYLIPGVLALP